MPTNGRSAAPGVPFSFKRCDFLVTTLQMIRRIARLSAGWRIAQVDALPLVGIASEFHLQPRAQAAVHPNGVARYRVSSSGRKSMQRALR
jgi:hypothetical protein